MSIRLVEIEIKRFLSSTTPEVMCISGPWGVGKTFAWNKYLRAAQKADNIALKRYSYISLFGVNSLEEFKYSIFENSVKSSEVDVKPSIETLRSNTAAVAERLGRKSVRFIQQLPFVKNYIGSISPAWFLSVSETIVCVDDIERTGAGLCIQNILGLASQLKELRRCKVILILNDEALPKEKDQDFRRYFEKVIDTHLQFAPSPEESAKIALDISCEPGKLIGECCVKLGIANIRLIKKIERSVDQVKSALSQFDPQVLTLATQSLVLFAWCIYEPDRAPSIEYLRRRRSMAEPAPKKGEVVSETEAAWNALLDAYRFGHMDEFDSVLFDGVRNGFFDELLLTQHASALDAELTKGKKERSFLAAWEMFHDSFSENETEVLDAIYASCKANLRNISPTNIDGTVRLLKDLGCEEQATEIIAEYVAVQGEDVLHFDNTVPFFNDVRDPQLEKALEEKKTSFKDRRQPAAVLSSIEQGWNPEDISLLAGLNVDDYYTIFKGKQAGDLRHTLNAALQFDRIVNASAEMKEISKKAKEALKRIGRESRINAQRVRRYGVEITAAPDQQSADR